MSRKIRHPTMGACRMWKQSSASRFLGRKNIKTREKMEIHDIPKDTATYQNLLKS
jgi:hypothetical protein